MDDYSSGYLKEDKFRPILSGYAQLSVKLRLYDPLILEKNEQVFPGFMFYMSLKRRLIESDPDFIWYAESKHNTFHSNIPGTDLLTCAKEYMEKNFETREMFEPDLVEYLKNN